MTPHVLFRKELRAVLPWFGAAVLCLGCAGTALQSGYRMYLAQPAFFLALAFGCAGLPAQAWGHEYSFGTLASLTAQPIERRTLMVVKIAAVAPLVAAIALGARWLLVAHVGRTDIPDAELFMAGVLCMITVAPLLTMLSRSVLGGTIFTIGVAGFLLVPADVIASAYYHFAPVAEVDALKWRLFWCEVVAVSVLCGAFSWRTFMRLEALDGGTAIDVSWPPAMGGRLETAVRGGLRHRAVVQAIAKELRLQQIGFVLTGVFATLWLAIAMLQRAHPTAAFPLDQLALLYFGLTAVVVGASASAEERQLGVLQSQLLLPRPAWWIWSVKAGVTLSVALLLGVALPLLVNMLGVAARPGLAHAWVQIAATVLLITSIGLFTSSFSGSMPRALVAALGVSWTCGLLFTRGVEAVAWRAWQYQHLRGISAPRIFAAYACCSGVLVLLGYGNHRSLDHGAGRIALQIAGFIAAEIVVLGVLAAFPG